MFSIYYFQERLKTFLLRNRVSYTYMIFLMCFHNSISVYSQNLGYYCPTSDTTSSLDSALVSPGCIDVDEILGELEDGDHCRLIWINVNVHFFVSDDCNGNLIIPANTPTSQANTNAEEILLFLPIPQHLRPIRSQRKSSIKPIMPII